MSEVHAAIARSQLRCLDGFIAARRAVAAIYDREIHCVEAIRPHPDAYWNYYKYCALLPPGMSRDRFKRELADRHGVMLPGEVFDLPLHLQEVLTPFAREPLAVAEDVCARLISLPLTAGMTEADAHAVADAMRGRLSSASAAVLTRTA
jgi:dTDP-4-amino-4,6-dideoxygalactose transaminase